MKKAIKRVKKYFSRNYEVLAAVLIFLIIIVMSVEFYKAIILMLEFIVIMEIVKMISDFIKKETLRLRYVIDIFIIFLIRDVIILSADKHREYFDIVFLLFVISIFFIFRILAVKFSPGTINLSKKKRSKHDANKASEKVLSTNDDEREVLEIKRL